MKSFNKWKGTSEQFVKEKETIFFNKNIKFQVTECTNQENKDNNEIAFLLDGTINKKVKKNEK